MSDVDLDGVVEAADEPERLTRRLPHAARAPVPLRLGLVQQTEAEAGLPPEVRGPGLTDTRGGQGAGPGSGGNLGRNMS